jgi:hypothetical protein
MAKDTKVTSKPVATKASENLQANSADKLKTAAGSTPAQTTPSKKK